MGTVILREWTIPLSLTFHFSDYIYAPCRRTNNKKVSVSSNSLHSRRHRHHFRHTSVHRHIYHCRRPPWPRLAQYGCTIVTCSSLSQQQKVASIRRRRRRLPVRDHQRSYCRSSIRNNTYLSYDDMPPGLRIFIARHAYSFHIAKAYIHAAAFSPGDDRQDIRRQSAMRRHMPHIAVIRDEYAGNFHKFTGLPARAVGADICSCRSSVFRQRRISFRSYFSRNTSRARHVKSAATSSARSLLLIFLYGQAIPRCNTLPDKMHYFREN